MSEVCLDETIPLVYYVNRAFGHFDVREWTGYYNEDGQHCEVATTPYLEQKNIYFCSSGGGSWFSGPGPRADNAGCQKLIQKLAKLGISELFRCNTVFTLGCANHKCDGECPKLKLIDEEVLEEHLEDKKIKLNADLLIIIEKDIIYLMSYYVKGFPCGSNIYKEDDYLEV